MPAKTTSAHEGCLPLAIDLFCGAGGLTRGLWEGGFSVVCCVDVDRWAIQTQAANHPQALLRRTDICQLTGEDLLGAAGVRAGELDLLAGGPPCKGFSQSNRRTRSLDNPKNLLYLHFLRLVAEIRPKWFLMENVWGLEHVEHGYARDDILRRAASLGYEVSFRVLNAANYGVPQVRRRIFFVGNREGRVFRFPRMLFTDPRRFRTVRNAIADLPELSNGHSNDECKYRLAWARASAYQRRMRGSSRKRCVTSNVVTRNSELVLARYRHIPSGGNWENIPAELMSNYADRSRCHTGIYRRLEWDVPCVVLANYRKNMLIHPRQDRGLSVREAARLQSFPDDFVFKGPLGTQQQQVADAVPPLLALAIAKAVRTQMGY